MALRSLCEPIELPLGASVIADRVEAPPDAPASRRFLHFHDVSELVLFGHVEGEFYAKGSRYTLFEGAIAFAPSMHHHDFDLAPGAKDWVLVQVDPYLTEQLAHQPGLGRLKRPFCAAPGPELRERLAMLSGWLVEAAVDDPTGPAAARLAELLLAAAATAPESCGSAAAGGSGEIDRLLPAVERLRREPGRPITLDEAAALCRLSTAYFSRRFKQVYGMNFTDYARVYRLHLAGRRIATSDRPISEIGYALGFSSPSHFAARFHERFGLSPREYRAAARRRAAGTG